MMVHVWSRLRAGEREVGEARAAKVKKVAALPRGGVSPSKGSEAWKRPMYLL